MSHHLERVYFCNAIVLPLLLVLPFYVTDFPSIAVAQSTDVTILDLAFETDEFPAIAAVAYKHGFNASLSSRNFNLAGRKVIFKSMTPAVSQVASSIGTAVGSSKDLFVVLGPTSAPHTVAALPALREKDVIAFGLITELSTARRWDRHLYFLFLNTTLSVHALLRHAVVNMRVRRVGFMYSTNVHFGKNEYEYARKKMQEMDRELCGVFSIDGRKRYTPNDKDFNEEWEKFAETLPQAVIIIGLRNSATKLFVEKMLKDLRTSSAFLMVPTMLERMTLNIWEKARADGAPAFPGQVFTTSTYPSPLDTSSGMVRRFRSAITKYFKTGVKKWTDQAEDNINMWGKIGATLGGWVAGEVFFQALSGFSASLERKDFIASLFNQRTYIIEEVIIGTFGDEISEDLEKAGAVARCNEGAVTAYVKKFLDGRNSETVPKGNYRRQLHICQIKNMILADSSAIVTVNITDGEHFKHYWFNEITKGQEAGLFFLDYNPIHDMTLKVLKAKYDTVTSTVQKEKESRWTNIVTGMMHKETLDIPDLTFIDPIFTVAQMNKFKRNVVFLAPTVEQQLFVLAEYVSTLHDRTVHAVVRSVSANELLDILRKSLLTFGVRLTSSVLLDEFNKSGYNLRSSGLTVLFGVEEADVPIFVAHLEENTDARLVVLCGSFTLSYKAFCKAFNGTEAADRLFLITNLPNWADANSSSEMVRNYHKNIRNSLQWSPLSLQSFIVGRFIQFIVDGLDVVSWSSVSDSVYSLVVVQLDEMTFGPFADSTSLTCSAESDPDSLDCAQNFGATSISIWPMSRVYDPNVGVLFGPVTPSMKYRLPSTGLTRSQLIGVIVGTLVGAAVLAVVIGLLFYFFCKGNANAPKDPEGPVTLIFTDIQSSTALWAACPDTMPDALEAHHRLIRRLIAKYKCYEVKTVGDSFMIACKSPYAAVKLVGDLQRTFLEYDWETSAIDNAYHVFEERQAEEDADYKPPTARLDDAVYREHWRGLRVRAGVHTGLADIRFDEVTKRYDYYGSTSNTAARTESIGNGGQVLLTRAAYMALSTAERKDLNVTALGVVELRGVPEPVRMFQLNPVPGRTFADLRLERGSGELDLETSTLRGMGSSDSAGDALSPAAESLCAVLHDICAPFPPQQRLKALMPFCKRWNVKLPVTTNDKDVLAVSRLAEQRLAVRISRVTERRQLTREGISDHSEFLSSAMGSLLLQSVSKTSSFRGNWFSKPFVSRLSQGTERQGRNHQVLFYGGRDSFALSSTSSIQVRKPSFFGVDLS